MHHGNIDVSSELGEGTTFRIHLMTGKEHFTNDQICTNSNTSCSNEVTNLNLVYQQPLEQEKENIDNESIPKEGKYKILIVEDNDSLREMLVNIFQITLYSNYCC